MKNILIVILFITVLSPAYSQHKKKALAKKVVKQDMFRFKMPYDARLVSNINQLQYDSVKIFSFGCPSSANHRPNGLLFKEPITADGDYMLSAGLVDATQHWLPLLSDTGRLVKKDDLASIFYLLKNRHHDYYLGDPSGCFEPHMGIVFYRNSLINAHMDVCLECNNIVFERFAHGKVIYEYDAGVMGSKTYAFFESLVPKYKLVTCSD